MILTLADTKFLLFYSWVKQLEAPTPVHVGQFWHNLPGRLVALTFAMTAVTYYVNNFGTLSPARLGGRLMRASDYTMRATAVGLYFPILWTMLYDPQAWPLCSGLGTLLVVLNNYLALRVAERGEEVGTAFTTLGGGGRRFIDDIFSEWWVLMFAYSAFMTIIGILLILHVAHDAWLFAILVVAINIIKMYRLNCVAFAPQVRGWLSREILTLRRQTASQARSAQEASRSGLAQSAERRVEAVTPSP